VTAITTRLPKNLPLPPDARYRGPGWLLSPSIVTLRIRRGKHFEHSWLFSLRGVNNVVLVLLDEDTPEIHLFDRRDVELQRP
jgi:hypothetical protein